MVVAETSDDVEKGKIEDAYFEVFGNIEGIRTNLVVVTEDEVTLKDLHNYKRWDKDSISFSNQNQSLPIEAGLWLHNCGSFPFSLDFLSAILLRFYQKARHSASPPRQHTQMTFARELTPVKSGFLLLRQCEYGNSAL